MQRELNQLHTSTTFFSLESVKKFKKKVNKLSYSYHTWKRTPKKAFFFFNFNYIHYLGKLFQPSVQQNVKLLLPYCKNVKYQTVQYTP